MRKGVNNQPYHAALTAAVNVLATAPPRILFAATRILFAATTTGAMIHFIFMSNLLNCQY